MNGYKDIMFGGEVLQLDKFDLKNLVLDQNGDFLNPRIAIIAKSGSGKSWVIKDILSYIKDVPCGCIIAPTDKTQLIAPLKAAVDQGIMVITVDTFIDDGKYQDGSGRGDFPMSYIASDNVLGGRMAARALANSIGSKGKVYVSNTVPGVSTTDQREEGFVSEMKNYPNIQVLKTQFNDDDANKAAAQLQAVVARTPDLAGVFGANLFSAIGSADGVKALGKVGKIKVVAFDAPTRIVDDIKTGLIDLAIAQHPAEIGYYGVVTAYAALTGQSIPVAIGTGFTVMDKSNIDDPEIRKFVYSD